MTLTAISFLLPSAFIMMFLPAFVWAEHVKPSSFQYDALMALIWIWCALVAPITQWYGRIFCLFSAIAAGYFAWLAWKKRPPRWRLLHKLAGKVREARNRHGLEVAPE